MTTPAGAAGHEDWHHTGAAGEDCPVDHGHLARYTLANPALQREVLELFQSRSTLYLARLKEADTDKDWTDAAHTIKGAARGIGAWRVAQSAGDAEKLSANPAPAGRLAAVADLERMIEEANRYISSFLAERAGAGDTDKDN